MHHQKNVWEFGCGNGSLLLAFNQNYNIVLFGIYISEPCLDVCKAIHLARADNFVSAELFPIKLEVCFMNSVSQYISTEEFEQVIRRLGCDTLVNSDIKDADKADAFCLNQAQWKSTSLQ